MISYSTQSIDADDISAVERALQASKITQGELVDRFERALAGYTGAKYALTFNSATSALFVAYKIAKERILTKGAENVAFLTTPISFCATANMMIESGIKPVFCDVDDSGNICVDSILKNLSSDIRAIVSVDFGGNSVKADEIARLCKERDLIFISDSSHALGGEYRGKKIGQFADMTIFSFHALKPITTCEGGAIVTNDVEFYHSAKLLRSHGVVKKSLWNSDVAQVGYNYRLSDVACALGISQLKKLDSFIEARHEIARFYDEYFRDDKYFRTIKIPDSIKSTHHLYPILLNERFWCAKEGIFREFLDRGIEVQVHYKPIYQFSLYGNLDFYLPRAEDFYKSEISIPCHQRLSPKDAEFIAKSAREIIEKFV